MTSELPTLWDDLKHGLLLRKRSGDDDARNYPLARSGVPNLGYI